jgi:hypothetical protein
MESLSDYFDLDGTVKAERYDIAMAERNGIPMDVSKIITYSEVGELC